MVRELLKYTMFYIEIGESIKFRLYNPIPGIYCIYSETFQNGYFNTEFYIVPEALNGVCSLAYYQLLKGSYQIEELPSLWLLQSRLKMSHFSQLKHFEWHPFMGFLPKFF